MPGLYQTRRIDVTPGPGFNRQRSPRRYTSISPQRTATSAISAALETSSFCLMWYRWVPTVLGLRLWLSAISATLRPRASYRKTANSFSVSAAMGSPPPANCASARAGAIAGSM